MCSAPRSRKTPNEPCMEQAVVTVNPDGPTAHSLCPHHFQHFCDYYETDEDARPPVKYLKYRPPGSE